MMKVNQFVDTLTKIEKEPTKYLSGGWGHYKDEKWCFDCICLIKSVLWGFNFDKNKPRGGGAVYASNGVPDIGENSMIKQCKNVSSDFTNIKKGEMLWMDGHAGVYVGDGNVIEATAGWDTWKVIKSQIGKNGERTYNGKGGSRNWEKHGLLPYVDYTEEVIPVPEPKPEPTPEPIPEPKPTPSQKFNIGDKVVINGAIYISSNADKAANYINNRTTYITRYATGAKHPYNTTGDLGWMDESSIKAYEGGITYTVKKGDTLSSIAAQYGMTWKQIYARNKFVIGNNPNLIKPGQVLVIKD